MFIVFIKIQHRCIYLQCCIHCYKVNTEFWTQTGAGHKPLSSSSKKKYSVRILQIVTNTKLSKVTDRKHTKCILETFIEAGDKYWITSFISVTWSFQFPEMRYIISLDGNLTTWNFLYNSLKPSRKSAWIIDNVFVWNDFSKSLHSNFVFSDKKAQYKIKNTQVFPLLYVVGNMGPTAPTVTRQQHCDRRVKNTKKWYRCTFL